MDLISREAEIEERKEESAQNVPKEDLISRKAAIDALIRKIRPHNNGDGTITMCVMSEELVRKTLDDLPSAQPEIVRCKDCANWIPGYVTDNDDFIPPKCGKYQQMVGHSSNDYCNFAERRTDEE